MGKSKHSLFYFDQALPRKSDGLGETLRILAWLDSHKQIPLVHYINFWLLRRITDFLQNGGLSAISSTNDEDAKPASFPSEFCSIE